jgi:small multidrug resistance pump
MHWLYLVLAISLEVLGTSALKLSDGFTRLLPSAVAVSGYIAAFFFFALALRVLPVGIAYAIWSGVGVAGVSLIGLIVFGQRLGLAEILGIALIVAGVVLVQVSANTDP